MLLVSRYRYGINTWRLRVRGVGTLRVSNIQGMFDAVDHFRDDIYRIVFRVNHRSCDADSHRNWMLTFGDLHTSEHLADLVDNKKSIRVLGITQDQGNSGLIVANRSIGLPDVGADALSYTL